MSFQLPSFFAASLLLAIATSSCSDDDKGTTDTRADTTTDTGTSDTTADTTPETSQDTAADTTPETSEDTAADSAPDDTTPADSAPGDTADTTPEGVSVLADFDPSMGQLPEGVAVDSQGNVYTDWSPLGQLLRIAPGAEEATPVGAISGLQEGDFGLIGLSVDGADDVYGCVNSANDAARGVWHFDFESDPTRVSGTEGIVFPNSVAFDGTTMYITDTIGADGAGAVWRAEAGGVAEVWAQSPLLSGTEDLGFGVPLGANGIAVYDGAVYVTVSERYSIVRIPIEEDGSPGEAAPFADFSAAGALAIPDGLFITEDGAIYVAFPGLHEIKRVAADGMSFETVASAADGLDVPSSVAVGPDGALYICSFSVAIEPLSNGNGPSVIRIER